MAREALGPGLVEGSEQVVANPVAQGDMPARPVVEDIAPKNGLLKFSGSLSPTRLAPAITISQYPEKFMYKYNR